MIRHYLTFAHQASALEFHLLGDDRQERPVLAECWSQEKNRLVLRFVRGRDSIFVEVSVDLQLGYALVKGDVQRARRNTIDFFQSLLGARLASVSIDDGERAIRLTFTDRRQLALFFFGKGAGNVVAVEEGEIVEALHGGADEYRRFLSPIHDDSSHDRDRIVESIRSSADRPSRALSRAIPELGRRLADEALYRRGLAPIPSLATLDDAEIDMLLEEVDRLYGMCERSDRFHLYYLPDELVFSLVPLESLAAESIRVETFDEIAHAVRAYRSTAYRSKRSTELRARLAKRLATERERLERSLMKGEENARGGGRAEAWERDAGLLLANLHAITKGEPQVVLHDWEGVERTIALDAKLTPAQNAERLYKRARGARDAAARWVTQREKLRRKIDRLAELAGRVERAGSIEELETIESSNREVFKPMSEPKEQGTAERFRRFEVAGGHEVYAGKNSANNDELTMRFARPNDYWFHARGTSGSHVVLKWNDPKSKPPRETLRQAASIAAYYSGAKGAKMVPVAYTLKKHVRKPKGAAVGAVVMEREEVVMVEPRLPG